MDVIAKIVLRLAYEYGGKLNLNSILGRVIAQNPDAKNNLLETKRLIEDAVRDFAHLSRDQIKQKLDEEHVSVEKIKQVPRKKLSLPNVKDEVVMRFAPSLSGPLHVGHAYVLSLNSELCRKYQGKLILRLEDTNPENVDLDAYELIPEDARWLTKDGVSEVVIQSDRLGMYYDFAEKLILAGHAYICTCSSDVWRGLSKSMCACRCRGLSSEENVKRFQLMFSHYKPGEAVMRVKTDLQNPNPALRDWPAMRINDHLHPRTKDEHRVWPLMNFSVAIDDHTLGVTHAIRAKDHMDNEKRQRFLYDYFGWKMPVNLYVGIINFTDLKLSTTETKRGIEFGKFEGWSDIKLPFLQALKRRGYQPDAFIKYALDVGLTQNDKKVSKEEFFKSLNHFNREVIDVSADRYFFVSEPVKVCVENAPDLTLNLAFHPDYPERGVRTFFTNQDFLIASEDFNRLGEGKVHRLMDCLNFVKKGEKLIFHSLSYEDFKKGVKGLIIHWLPASEKNGSVLRYEGVDVEGVAEHSLFSLKSGMVVQLERVGFVRLDKVEGSKLVFWFAHR